LSKQKEQFIQYKTKSDLTESTQRAELSNFKQRESAMKREMADLKIQISTMQNEFKTKELRWQANISDSALQANTARQDKMVLEHTIEEYKKEIKELKEQLGNLTVTAPSMYLNSDKEDIFQNEESEKLKCDIFNNNSNNRDPELQKSLYFSSFLIVFNRTMREKIPSPETDKTLKQSEAKIAKLKDELKRLQQSNEKEVGKLGTENEYLRDKLAEYEKKLEEYEGEGKEKKVDSRGSDSKLRDLLISLKEENEKLKAENKQRNNEKLNLEQKLIDMKVKLADYEIAQEHSSPGSTQIDEQKSMRARIQTLENELVNTKEKLAEMMNKECEQEMRVIELEELLKKNGIFDFLSDNSKNSKKKK